MSETANLCAVLSKHGREQPNHPAIVEGARSLTYRELDQLVRQCACLLIERGVRPADVVGVCLRDRTEHLVFLYAVAACGAIILPLDWRWTREETIRIVEFFGAKIVLTEPGHSIDANELVVDQALMNAATDCEPLGELIGGGPDPAVLSLSSGTTGRPKGPALSHTQFVHRFVFQQDTLGMSANDRYLCATPLYFGAGRGLSMGCLHAGGTVLIFAPPFEPEALVKFAAQSRATMLLTVPTLLRRLMQLDESSSPVMFPGLRVLVSTGASLHSAERSMVMKRLSPAFINYYGSTEGGGVSVLLPEHGPEADGSVGRTIISTEVQIVDAENRPVPTDEIGQIRYRSPGVADSFFNDPQASATAFRDGWYYPGDLGRIDRNGFLYLTGRIKDVIIRGGANIYPDEIEAILSQHPAVSEVAVAGIASEEYGEQIVAFVVPLKPVSPDDLVAHCRKLLAPYKIPSQIVMIDTLPKTVTGKVIKAELNAFLPAKGSD